MCDKCNESRIRALHAMAVALLAQTQGTENESAGVLSEKIALTIADKIAAFKHGEDGDVTDESHEAVQAEASAAAKEVYDTFDSNVISEMEFACGFLAETIEVLQNSARAVLLARYKDGDRSMSEYHQRVAEGVTNARTGLAGLAAMFGHDASDVEIEEEESVVVVRIGSPKRRPARDTAGNPIMAPVADVS